MGWNPMIERNTRIGWMVMEGGRIEIGCVRVFPCVNVQIRFHARDMAIPPRAGVEEPLKRMRLIALTY